jgi:integrase
MLSDAVTRHIELYRSMGFKYRAQAYMLKSFAAFAEGRSEAFIRTDTVLEWAVSAPSVSRRYDRLLTIRRFASALKAEDDRHQVPPDDAFGRAQRRHRKCHIFAPHEINLLLQAAAQLKPKGTIRPAVYVALFSLLAATGLRISEALKLQMSDITEDGLLIRETKFQKSRLVPLHASAHQGLRQYLVKRSRIRTIAPNVFVSRRGDALPYDTVKSTFLYLARSEGLREGPGHGGCRIHDIRHTFAVRSLEQCSGDRRAIAQHMAALSTYLGHAHISDTYWYLQVTPKLLDGIALAAEILHQGGEQ